MASIYECIQVGDFGFVHMITRTVAKTDYWARNINTEILKTKLKQKYISSSSSE